MTLSALTYTLTAITTSDVHDTFWAETKTRPKTFRILSEAETETLQVAKTLAETFGEKQCQTCQLLKMRNRNQSAPSHI